MGAATVTDFQVCLKKQMGDEIFYEAYPELRNKRFIVQEVQEVVVSTDTYAEYLIHKYNDELDVFYSDYPCFRGKTLITSESSSSVENFTNRPRFLPYPLYNPSDAANSVRNHFIYD